MIARKILFDQTDVMQVSFISTKNRRMKDVEVVIGFGSIAASAFYEEVRTRYGMKEKLKAEMSVESSTLKLEL